MAKPKTLIAIAKYKAKERFSYKLGKASKSKGYKKDPKDKILNKLVEKMRKNPTDFLAKLDVKIYVVERYINTIEEATNFRGCQGIKTDLKDIRYQFNKFKELKSSNPEKLDNTLTKFMQKLNSLVRKESLHMRLRNLNTYLYDALQSEE